MQKPFKHPKQKAPTTSWWRLPTRLQQFACSKDEKPKHHQSKGHDATRRQESNAYCQRNNEPLNSIFIHFSLRIAAQYSPVAG